MRLGATGTFADSSRSSSHLMLNHHFSAEPFLPGLSHHSRHLMLSHQHPQTRALSFSSAHSDTELRLKIVEKKRITSAWLKIPLTTPRNSSAPDAPEISPPVSP